MIEKYGKIEYKNKYYNIIVILFIHKNKFYN